MGFFKIKKCNEARALLKKTAKRYKRKLKRKYKYNNEQRVLSTYYNVLGRYPDLKDPQRYTEKVQWVKLYYDNPLYVKCADKYTVREYVSDKGLGHILNEVYGVYKSPEEINLDALPEKFVIKATHGCGWNFVCKNKAEAAAIWSDYKLLFAQWLRQDYSVTCEELHYYRMVPRLICERYVEGFDNGTVLELKIFCFHGEPKFILVDFDLPEGYLRASFDTEWVPTDFKFGIQEAYPSPIAKPENLREILDIARKLSADHTHVRVDLYVDKDRIYFGELTFTSGSGLTKISPDGADEMIGSWWRLPLDSSNVIK